MLRKSETDRFEKEGVQPCSEKGVNRFGKEMSDRARKKGSTKSVQKRDWPARKKKQITPRILQHHNRIRRTHVIMRIRSQSKLDCDLAKPILAHVRMRPDDHSGSLSPIEKKGKSAHIPAQYNRSRKIRLFDIFRNSPTSGVDVNRSTVSSKATLSVLPSRFLSSRIDFIS